MEVDYLKIGSKVYSISEIQGEGIDINAELKEFYEQRHGQLADEFGQVLNNNMQEEWEKQIAHLRKIQDKGSIAISANDYNKMVMVFNGKLMFVKVIEYAPSVITCSMGWLGNNPDGLIDLSSEMWAEFTDSTDVVITCKPRFTIPLVLAFDPKADKLHTPFMHTYHTMGSKSLCTGNNKASTYWKLSDVALASAINSINTFSLAQSSVDVKGTRYHIREYLSNDTILNVQEREMTQWRA